LPQEHLVQGEHPPGKGIVRVCCRHVRVIARKYPLQQVFNSGSASLPAGRRHLVPLGPGPGRKGGASPPNRLEAPWPRRLGIGTTREPPELRHRHLRRMPLIVVRNYANMTGRGSGGPERAICPAGMTAAPNPDRLDSLPRKSPGQVLRED
jgi:hypothetical protein